MSRSEIKEQLLAMDFDKRLVEFALEAGDSFDACLNICLESAGRDVIESAPLIIGVCEKCTYENDPGAFMCEICGSRLPLSEPSKTTLPSLPSKPSQYSGPSFSNPSQFPGPSLINPAPSYPSPFPGLTPSKPLPSTNPSFQFRDPAPKGEKHPPLGPEPPADWVDFSVIKAKPAWNSSCVFLYRRLLRPETETIPTAGTSMEYKLIPQKDIGRIFRQYVKDFDRIRDRLNTMPALRLIEMTYDSGIPQLNQQGLVLHSRDCLRYILGLAALDPTLHWKRYLTRVAEAFSSCQAEQARVLDAVYGELAGRDKGLIQQIDAIVSNKKHVLLEIICQNLNPTCRSPGAAPSEQIPHLMNAYIMAVGTQLGIKGVAAASHDRCAKRLTDVEINKILTQFRKTFSIVELAKDVINDVNQQSKDADRLIDLASLMTWAGDTSVNNGFPRYSIFYDGDAPKGTYGDDPKDNTKPTAENAFAPFLSNDAGVLVLYHLYAAV